MRFSRAPVLIKPVGTDKDEDLFSSSHWDRTFPSLPGESDSGPLGIPLLSSSPWSHFFGKTMPLALKIKRKICAWTRLMREYEPAETAF